MHGRPAQVQSWWLETKCSAENTWTGRRVTRAVPTPFVPTTASSQSAPTVKPSRSALRRIDRCPSRHSSRPSASATTMMCRASSSAGSSPSRSTGRTSRSGETCRRSSVSAADSVRERASRSGCTPPASIRRQDSAISGRGAAGGRSPASAAARTPFSSRVASRASMAEMRATSTVLPAVLATGTSPC